MNPSKPSGNEEMTSIQNNEDEDIYPEGECQMQAWDDSYDDHFGKVRIKPYLQCNVCGRTESIPAPEY